MSVAVGESFVDFSLSNQDDELVVSSDLRGKWVVLFVYPADDTPGCTIEAKAFTEAYSSFKEAGAEVFGLSPDGVKSHKDFCNKYDLTVPLLSDPQGHLLNAIGVEQKESQSGQSYWARTSFLIDPNGVLKKVYNDVQPKGHEQEVMADLKSFKGE